MNAYVRERVKQVLQRCRGDQAAAQKMLLQLAVKDVRLLQGLVAPHIQAITAHAISGVADNGSRKAPRLQGGGRSRNSKRSAMTKRLSSKDIQKVMDQLGERIGITDVPRGMTALVTPPQRRQSNQTHADTMRQLAVAFARKRFDPDEQE